MTRPLYPSEEYILAAFLSGELPEHLRREIIAYLADHDQARDLLAMAQDALDAAESGDGSANVHVPEARLARPVGWKWLPTGPFLDKNLWKVTTFFAGAVLVLAVIVAFMALNTSRMQRVLLGEEWTPVITGENVSLEWEEIPGTASYHIMRFDGEEAAIVGRTEESRFDLDQLDTGSLTGSESVWVLALGPEGQFLDRSRAVRIQQHTGGINRP